MADLADFKTDYGSVALVTGASSGIGRSFALLLAQMGFDLVLVARRVDRLEALADKLTAEFGVNVRVCPVDLAEPTAAQQILDATSDLDIGLLVSNAGFGLKGQLSDSDPASIADMLSVNCLAPVLLARGFIPRLRARQSAGIILTSSVEGLIGCPYSAAYSATKGFVNNLGEALWAELAGDAIDVLTLCPGATDTEAPVLQGIDPSTLKNLMSPDDVARLALQNIKNGPLYIPSDHYRAVFEHLLAMPKEDALRAMVASVK